MRLPFVRNLLSRALYRRGWTDQALAGSCSIPRSRMNQIKNCAVQPSIGEALAICDVLGENLDTLFYFESDPAQLRSRGL